jgi:hypothetical protein
MASARALDPGPGRRDATSVERDRDQLETQWSKFLAYRLPDRQVMPASSPGCPGQEQHLLSAQRAELQGLPMNIRQHQVRRLRRGECVVCCWWAECPQPCLGIVEQWHAEELGEACQVQQPIMKRSCRKWSAHVIAAQSFWLELPAGACLKLVGAYQQVLKEHAAVPVYRALTS